VEEVHDRQLEIQKVKTSGLFHEANRAGTRWTARNTEDKNKVPFFMRRIAPRRRYRPWRPSPPRRSTRCRAARSGGRGEDNLSGELRKLPGTHRSPGLKTVCTWAEGGGQGGWLWDKKKIHSWILNALCKRVLYRPRALAAGVLCSITQSASRKQGTRKQKNAAGRHYLKLRPARPDALHRRK
jgi:hypothetical protein